MKRFLVGLLVLLIAALTVGADSIQPPHGFSGRVYKSTIALYGTKKGKTHFLCTAEPIKKIKNGYELLTAGHCVQETPVDLTFAVADEIGGQLTTVTVLKAYEGGGIDFALFEFPTTKKYFIFEIGDDNDLHVGDRIINPNFAYGISKQLSLGVISSQLVPPGEVCGTEECVGDFLAQLYGAPGSSGSAVISARTHKIIGLMVYGFQYPIGFGIEPISKFQKFLDGPNQPHPIDDDDDGQ